MSLLEQPLLADQNAETITDTTIQIDAAPVKRRRRTGISWCHVVGLCFLSSKSAHNLPILQIFSDSSFFHHPRTCHTGITYFCVGGGPFGFEESLLATNNAALSITFLLGMVVLWAFPQALYITELSSKFTHGYTQWVLVALGDVVGVAHGYVRSICNVITNSAYMVLFQHYLSRMLYNKALDDVSAGERLAMTCPYVAVVLLLNIMGVQLVGTASIVFSLLVILPFAALFVVALPFIHWRDVLFGYRWSSDINFGVLFSVLVFNLIGFDDVGNLSGKVHNRNRNLPLGMLLALLLVATTYIVPSITVASILNNDFMHNPELASNDSVYVYFTRAALDCSFYHDYLVNRTHRLHPEYFNSTNSSSSSSSLSSGISSALMLAPDLVESSSWQCPFQSNPTLVKVLSWIINVDSILATFVLGVVYMQTSSEAQAHCSKYGLLPAFVRKPFDLFGWCRARLCCCCGGGRLARQKHRPTHEHTELVPAASVGFDDSFLDFPDEDRDDDGAFTDPHRDDDDDEDDDEDAVGSRVGRRRVQSCADTATAGSVLASVHMRPRSKSNSTSSQCHDADSNNGHLSTPFEEHEDEDRHDEPVQTEPVEAAAASVEPAGSTPDEHADADEVAAPVALSGSVNTEYGPVATDEDEDEESEEAEGHHQQGVPAWAIVLQCTLMFVLSHLVNFDEILEVQSYFYCVSIMLITLSYLLLKFWRPVPCDTVRDAYSLSPRLKVPIIAVCVLIICICVGCVLTFSWQFVVINTSALLAVVLLSVLLVKCRVLRLHI